MRVAKLSTLDPRPSTLLYCVTITFTESALPSLVAVTRDEPAAAAVIVPVDVTFTRVVSELAHRISRPSRTLPDTSTNMASRRMVSPRGSAMLSGAMTTRATGTPLFEGPIGPPSHAARTSALAAAANFTSVSRVATRA
jgi:hypothetical protein